MKRIATSACLATLILCSTSATADAPNPGEVYIEGLSYEGNGCAPGTVAYNISPDAKAFTVLFDNFIVDTEEGSQAPGRGRWGRGRALNARKSCDLNIDMHVPAGWSFSFFCVEYRGYASLSDGLVGQQSSAATFMANSPFFPGRPGRRGPRVPASRPTHLGTMILEGPYDDDYQRLFELGLETVSWSNCDQSTTKTLSLKTDMQIRPRSFRGIQDAEGIMTVDSVDGELAHHYGIAWRRCDGGPDRRPGGRPGRNVRWGR